MNLRALVEFLTPRAFKRSRDARRRLSSATSQNRRVVNETAREVRKVRIQLERAIISRDIRDIDCVFDRESD